MTLRAQPALASAFALLAVLGSARVALAGECATDDDCGHGFECEAIMSGTGGASGSSGGSAVGGTAGTAAAGAGAAAGTSGFAPPRDAVCGDGLCQVTETATTCVIDCTNSMCVLAVCDTSDDCAEGYECEDESLPGTGGASGPVCGDGICTSGETQASCPDDCTATRRCTPAGGLCTSDANCAPGFYCSFVGSGTGGASASGSTGAGGFTGGASGASGSSSGGAAPAAGGAAPASGGTAGSSGSSAGSATGGTGSGDAAVAAGTCMPLDDGAGGTTGSGGSIGSGGAGTAGVGTGGTGFAGAGAVGTGATGGVGTGGSVSTGGSSGTGSGGTSGSGGSGGDGAGGGGGSSGSANGTGGTGTGAGGTGSNEDQGSAERGGCSIATPRARAPLAELGVLLLVGLGVLRRRRDAR